MGRSSSKSPDARAGATTGHTSGWRTRNRVRRVDGLLTITLAALATGASWIGSIGLDAPLALDDRTAIWFQADTTRVFENATDRDSLHYRAAVHPLFALLIQPLVAAQVQTFDIAPLIALRNLRALAAGAAAALLYRILRRVAGRPAPATVFTLVGMTSAAGIFWFTVPETYPFAAVTILAALALAAGRAPSRNPLRDVGVQLATFSITISNWLIGLFVTLSRHRPTRAALISAVSLALGLALMSVQHVFYRGAPALPFTTEESRYIARPGSGGPLRIATTFFINAVVAPPPATVPRSRPELPDMLSLQFALPRRSGAIAVLTAAIWLTLLTAGTIAVFRARRARRLRGVLLLTVALQLVLHLVYGPETFLYAAHYVPALVILAAFATLILGRRPVIIIGALLVLALTSNNLAQWSAARAQVAAAAASLAAKTTACPSGEVAHR